MLPKKFWGNWKNHISAKEKCGTVTKCNQKVRLVKEIKHIVKRDGVVGCVWLPILPWMPVNIKSLLENSFLKTKTIQFTLDTKLRRQYLLPFETESIQLL